MKKLKPFLDSIIPFLFKKSPIVVTPFKYRVSIKKTCFPPILMPELYHTGILKMY